MFLTVFYSPSFVLIAYNKQWSFKIVLSKRQHFPDEFWLLDCYVLFMTANWVEQLGDLNQLVFALIPHNCNQIVVAYVSL